MECDKLKLVCDTEHHQTERWWQRDNCSGWHSRLSQWVKVVKGDWHGESYLRVSLCFNICICVCDRSSGVEQRGGTAYWIKVTKPGDIGWGRKERGSQEKERDQVMWRWMALSHTHTQRMWSICTDTRSDISAGVGEEMGCLLALTVLGGLSASQQLLYCELCWTNVNLPLPYGDFKLKQNRKARDRNKGRRTRNVWNLQCYSVYSQIREQMI